MPWRADGVAARTRFQWRRFYKESKNKYPVRWFIFHTIPWSMPSPIHRLKRIKWKIYHRFIPRYQYNIIRTSLKPGYYDPDMRILYAVMDIASKFVEDTKDTIDWNDNQRLQEVHEDLTSVHKWWTEERPAIIQRIDSIYESMVEDDDEDLWDGDHPAKLERRRLMTLAGELDDTLKIQQTIMLIKVCRHLPYMWYP